MAIFDSINIPPCVWFAGEEKRNSIMAIISGLLFFTGWWLAIDAQSVYPAVMKYQYHLCGIVGTVSFVIVNALPNTLLRGDSIDDGFMKTRTARIWLFIGFVMGFISIIASCWILFAEFVHKSVDKWPGAEIFLQNALIFLASLVFKFGRVDQSW